MKAKIIYTRDEFEKIVLIEHEKFFPAPDDYEWQVATGGYSSEVIIELEHITKGGDEDAEDRI